MMRRKTKTEITILQRQRIRLRLPHERLVWCERCAAQVWMLALDEATALAQMTARAIFRGVEAGELHFLEAEDGALFVCRASLELIKQKQEEEYECL